MPVKSFQGERAYKKNNSKKINCIRCNDESVSYIFAEQSIHEVMKAFIKRFQNFQDLQWIKMEY